MLLSSSSMRSSSTSTSSSFLPTTRSTPAPNFWIASVIGAIFLSPPDLIERWLPMIAPFPTTLNEYEHRRIVNKILNDCWTNDGNNDSIEEDMKIKNYGFELEPSDDWIVDNQIQNQNQNQNQQVIKTTKEEDDFDDDHNDNDEMENRYRNEDIIKGTKRDPATTIKSTDSIFLNYFLCLHLLFSLPSLLNEEEQDGNDNDIFANDTVNTMPSIMMKDRKKTTMIMKPSTYGEITPLGARQLFGAMGLYDYNRNRCRNRKRQHSDSDADDDDGAHFYDLGSGTGKLVAQAVFELSSPLLGKTTLKKATGIELSPSRHKVAIQSKQNTLNTLCNTKKLKSLFSSSSSSSRQQYEYNIYHDTATNIINDTNNNKLELIQGDLFDIDLSAATHIYIASLCFPDNLMLKLEERLMTLLTSISKQQQDRDRDDENDSDNNGEKDDTIIAPATKRSRTKKQKQQQQLQCIATLRKFPNDLGGIKPIIRYMEMSWTSPLGSPVYLYHVSDRIV